MCLLHHINFSMATLGILTAILGITLIYVGRHGTWMNNMQYRTMLQRLHPTRGFFRAFTFAAGVPFVSAEDSGDEFSNNLFTDIAPILALFGEQVGPQFDY